jgi:hypothetical protein
MRTHDFTVGWLKDYLAQSRTIVHQLHCTSICRQEDCNHLQSSSGSNNYHNFEALMNVKDISRYLLQL